MTLLEYEAKQLLKKHGLPVPHGVVVKDAAMPGGRPLPVVLKAQIPKGGRGKAGGVRVVHDEAEYLAVAGELLGKPLLGCRVDSLLAEEALQYVRELYVAVTVDRSIGRLVLLAHGQGGIDIEQAADEIVRIPLAGSPDQSVAQRLGEALGLQGRADELLVVVQKLYDMALAEDALLVEVNPLMVLDDGSLVCADAKVELDDAAQFRHPEWAFEYMPVSGQFVVLDAAGTVASMANGAGLAMATVDAIKVAGAEPANFYDVGGGTNIAGMVAAFQKIADMPEVRAIVVNIFGGITRCDEVAEAIVEAQKKCHNLPVLCIRLTGTNEAEGKSLLDAAGVQTFPTLADCVAEAVKV